MSSALMSTLELRDALAEDRVAYDQRPAVLT